MVGAHDLTISPAPKSVSVLWALGDNRLRYELELMVAQAANAAVTRMLREQPLVRQRYGLGPRDVRHVVAGDYVGAQAFHTTARMSANGRGVPDPQLHVHNLLIGAVTADGQLRALDSRPILRYQAELDAEASGHLAVMLKERGFEIERRLESHGNGQPWVRWEVRGVPEGLINAMSSRSSEIEDLKRKFTKEYGRDPIGPAWEAWIVLQRGPKAKLTAPELRVEWELEAEEHAFGAAAVDDLVLRADERRAAGATKRPRASSPEAGEFRRLLLEHICRDHAFVPFSEMERLARQLGVGLIDPRTTDCVVGEMMGDGDLLVTTDDKVTTLEIVARRMADQLLSAPIESPVPAEHVEAELKRRAAEGTPFDEHQARAVRLAASGARFVSIAGPAGTGKGMASRSLATLLHRKGRRLIAAAVAGRTAQTAATDAGADEVMNLDQLRVALDNGDLRLAPADVLLVDEAAIIDHKRYARLLEAVAASGATLVQVGDDKQLSAVGPGGLWTTVHRQAEAADRAVELREVRRAHNPREAQAWAALRDGRTEEALTWMQEQGRLRVYDRRAELHAGVVDAWWAGDRDGLMVVDTSNEERDELNALAQAKRLEAGELGTVAVRLVNGCELRKGDRVLFNAIYKADLRGVPRVENGTLAEVVAVDAERGQVELALAEPIRNVKRRLAVGLDVPVELGYARHVLKAQGVTAEDTELVVSRRTPRNELYVMATRARAGARVHAIATELAEELDVDTDRLRAASALSMSPRESEAERQADQGDAETSAEPPASAILRDLVAEIEAARARRAAEVEYATIRRISERAQRSSAKEAVGDRPMRVRAEVRQAHQATTLGRGRDDLSEHLAVCADTAHKWERSLTLDRAAPAVARRAAEQAAGRERPARPGRVPPQTVRALPARDAIECMGRARLEDHDTACGLAYYMVAGRLQQADDPAAEAARRWISDRQAPIVVEDRDQERRVRAEIARLQAGAEAQCAATPIGGDVSASETAEPVDVRKTHAESSAEPIIIHGPDGYTARAEHRQLWLDSDDRVRTLGRHVEPGAPLRAYVVAREPWASQDLVRAVSVAAESHLLVPSLRPGLASQVEAEARRIWAGQALRKLERDERQAAHARGLAYERRQPAVDRAAEREGAGLS